MRGPGMGGFCLQSVNMNFMTLDWVCLLIQPVASDEMICVFNGHPL